jgi:hypothetical protein
MACREGAEEAEEITVQLINKSTTSPRTSPMRWAVL